MPTPTQTIMMVRGSEQTSWGFKVKRYTGVVSSIGTKGPAIVAALRVGHAIVSINGRKCIGAEALRWLMELESSLRLQLQVQSEGVGGVGGDLGGCLDGVTDVSDVAGSGAAEGDEHEEEEEKRSAEVPRHHPTQPHPDPTLTSNHAPTPSHNT